MPSMQMPKTVATFITILSFGSLWNGARASAGSTALGFMKHAYTTNALCSKSNCINPVFPAMEDLHRLEQVQWIASTLQTTSSAMGFCRNAISHDPALPVPEGGSSSVKQLVQRQDNAASTMFYYHLSALGLEAWDHQKPDFANDCIRSIWRMVCYTYFPRAEVGAADGALTNYIRPCKSSCMNYIRTCGVECCDESVQCVFTHTKAISATQNVTSQGYMPHDGPSSMCTGAAHRSTTPLGKSLWALVALTAFSSLDWTTVARGIRTVFVGMGGRRMLVIATMATLAMALQGCEYDVPMHRIGNWRTEPDYLMKHEFIAPGGSAKSANINSCSLARLSQSLQCSGRGVCKTWDLKHIDNNLAFCECDRGWADPECRTPRKSQAVAYGLSMFFGMLGADQFYLGFPVLGLIKLFTLGGLGIWWVADIIRIGSAPVYSNTYRTAADLPHWAYVLTCVMFAVFMGFALAYKVTTSHRARRRKDAMLLSEDEEKHMVEAKPFVDAYRITKTNSDSGLLVGARVPQSPVISSPSYGAMAAGPFGNMNKGPMAAMQGMPMAPPVGSIRTPW